MKECTLIPYSTIENDNFIDRSIDDVIEIDVEQLIPGQPLPIWNFSREIPVVKYYDGESLDLEYKGKCFSVIAGEQTGILSNPVSKRTGTGLEVDIRLEKTVVLPEHPAWKEMRAHYSFNAIVMQALPVAENDPDAARHLLRIFSEQDIIYLLDNETVKLLEEYAVKKNKYAAYCLGRYHQVTQPDNDSNSKAIMFTTMAYELGLPDASASFSEMYGNGFIGIVDKEKSRQLLDEALDQGCDFAYETWLFDLVFNHNDEKAVLQKVLDKADRLIDKDIYHYGKGEENPMWYYIKGCAESKLYGNDKAKDSFVKAARSGVLFAWNEIAVSNINDNGDIIDKDAYLDAIEYGASKRCAACHFFIALERMDIYDTLPDFAKETEREMIIAILEYAVSLGSAEAAEKLGDIYYFGELDEEVDDDFAQQWYEQGIGMKSIGCHEKLFHMLGDLLSHKDKGIKDMIALYGTRLGSDSLMKETVKAYKAGRLSEFSSEIERYYLPIVQPKSKYFS